MADTRNGFSRLWLFVALLSLVLFAESAIPYWYAEKRCGTGHVFLGQIAYTPDQNMYFSFISQARDGQFAFYNKLTATPNAPVFVNLEWWLAGFIQHVTGISENAAYQVWRFLGVLLLTIGFVLMARIVLPSARRVKAAAVVALATGGFGFVFAILNGLHLIGPGITQPGIIDMRYGLLPFQQMLTNPHFSFPHGLILVAYALYLLGEQEGRTKYYVLSGLFFTIIGLVRPYDIIPPFVIFPLHVLLSLRHKPFDVKRIAIQLLPLFIVIPVLLYNVWLFKVNEVFKYWSQQGLNAGAMPAPLWHFMAYGILGVLAIIRMTQLKARPLSKNEQFLVLWFAVTFLFIQLGRYFPILGWSPQIGVYLAVPLALLGFNANYRSWLNIRAKRGVAIAVVGYIVVISNVSIVLYYVKNFRDESKKQVYYATKDEMDALQWLKQHTHAGDVALALPTASQRIAKYTKASVVAGHYSVTPKFNESAALAMRLLADTALSGHALDSLHITYVFAGPEERATHKIHAGSDGLYAPLYSNRSVTIYGNTRLTGRK
jgi:hypothetical protein